MAVTVSSILSNFNSYIGDTSTDRISDAERLQYITEATSWLQGELQNDLQNATYPLNYYDSVHYYKVTSAVADLLDGSDLRRSESDQRQTFARKSPRELAEEIGQQFSESSWGVERRDGNSYLVINHKSKYSALTISSFNSVTDGGGTWAVDTTNGDATNLTVDVNEFKQGNASLNFDVDVSQSGSNRAVISNTSLNSFDLSSYEDLAALMLWVYVPNVTYTSSVTIYWGSSTSNYWSATTTTDINGNAFVAGWNRVKVNWSDATATGSPDATAVEYARIDINYGGSQTDDTDYRVDDFIIVRPEPLTFHYIGWYVGTDTTGASNLTAFTATTDIPFFSGQYDQYKYAVAHKAASLALQNLRLLNEAQMELGEAIRIINTAKTIIPSSKNPITKSFKIRGVSFRRRY